jgi:hypothetical protein
VGGVLSLVALAGLPSFAQFGDDLEEAPIRYSTTPTSDAIARLQKRLDDGSVRLRRDPDHGYLRAVLAALQIPVSSQSLVFSKTSFQRDLISPAAPRAIYFNDDVYIGWVQGGPVLEVSSSDPRLGGVFYVLDQHELRPRFLRQNHECLQCHASSLTRGIPGHMVRSVFTRVDGQPIFQAGGYVTSDESPLEERFGGWYVTGTHGAGRHLGNLLFRNPAEAERPNREEGANHTALGRSVDLQPYLTPHSDLSAQLVMQHQTHLHNLITRAGYETSRALHYDEAVRRDLGVKEGERLPSTNSRIRSVCEQLVRGLLFSRAAPLPAPVRGSSTFAADFMRRGPRDHRGRSLRELDLRTRLLRYPCSYLIYSEAFDGLPREARAVVYRRLAEVLRSTDPKPEFAHLSPADRQAITEILMDTRPEFAAASRD